jgi:hypothetical protein
LPVSEASATAAAENLPNDGSVSASTKPGEKGSQSQQESGMNSQPIQRTQIESALFTKPQQTVLSSETQESDQAQHVVAENDSEGGQPRPSGRALTAGTLRRADSPITAAVPDVAAPRSTEAASSESQPGISLPGMQAEHGEIANNPGQSDRIPQFRISAIGALPTQQSEQSGGELASQSAATGYHVDRISIHYRGNERSRLVAHRLLVKLASANVGTVEMRTTAHVMSESTVRYFFSKDAPAAFSLAKALGTNPSAWRVEDCTAYRHKPEPGTVEIWPATAERNRNESQ